MRGGDVLRGGRDRRWLLAFVGTAWLMGAWALSTPLMLVPDEASHTIRAVSLWQGDLLGDRRLLVREGPPRVEAVNFVVRIPAGYRHIAGQTTCSDDGMKAAGCAPPLVERPGTLPMGTSAGAYPPLWYAVFGAGSRLLSPVEAVYAGRLLGALASAALVAAAVWAAGRLSGRAGVAIALLAMTPTAAWLGGSINPNGPEIAAATALWFAVPVLLGHPRSRSAAVVVAVAALAAAWTRPLSPLSTAGILVAATVAAASPEALVRAWRAEPFRLGVLSALIGIAGAMLWVVATDALDTFIAVPDPSLTPAVAAGESWAATPLRLAAMVGRFGLLTVPLPGPLLWLWAAAVAVVVLGALVVGRWPQRVVLVGLLVVTAGLPVVAESLTAARLGFTWQGRYSLPIAVGVLAVAAVAWRDRAAQAGSVWRGLLVGAVAVVVVVGHVGAFVIVAARASGGPAASVLRYPVEGWAPPIPEALLLGLAVLGAVALAGAALVPEPPVKEPTGDR